MHMAENSQWHLLPGWDPPLRQLGEKPADWERRSWKYTRPSGHGFEDDKHDYYRAWKRGEKPTVLTSKGNPTYTTSNGAHHWAHASPARGWMEPPPDMPFALWSVIAARLVPFVPVEFVMGHIATPS